MRKRNDRIKACMKYEYMHMDKTPYNDVLELIEAYDGMNDEEIAERYAIYYRRGGKIKPKVNIGVVNIYLMILAILVLSGVFVPKIL